MMIFDFLTTFKGETNTLGVSKAHSFLIISTILSGRAESHLGYIRNGARSGGVLCWPKVDHHLLRKYTTLRLFAVPSLIYRISVRILERIKSCTVKLFTMQHTGAEMYYRTWFTKRSCLSMGSIQADKLLLHGSSNQKADENSILKN